MNSDSTAEPGELPCSSNLIDPIRELAARYPGTPFLALGQTIFWDEPLKSVVRHGLDAAAPETPLVLAVHDTDYFARPHATLSSRDPYIIVAHNDRSTQNLWCAAGELSELFGAETVPTRAALRKAGVRLDVAAAAHGGDDHVFLDKITEAWGWRGITHTSGVETLTHEVATADVLQTLLAQLQWGFSRSAETLCHCTGTEKAEALAEKVLSAVTAAADRKPKGSLSDLYQEMFPSMCALVSGEELDHLQVSHSLRESRFNPETCRKPRFRILDLFLAPESRSICVDAYNEAVAGSEIYRLEQFGEGSIPFDLVTSSVGRGTLRILDDGIYVEGRKSDFIPTSRRVESAAALAETVTAYYGPDVSLVGKAITWISMLSAEFIFIFNEGASSYTHRTARMLRLIREAGIPIGVHPLLRVRYGAWDALQEVESGFCLPDHYAEAFGQREIAAAEFAGRWREVMNEQEELLLELGRLTRPVDLLQFLNGRSSDRWGESRKDYLEARQIVRAANAAAPAGEHSANDLRGAHYRAGLKIDQLQKRLGVLRRERLAAVNTDEDVTLTSEWNTVAREIAALRTERTRTERQRTILRHDVETLRTSSAYRQAVASLRTITARAEMERLRLARNAYLVVHSLEHNNRRPTGWWLPVVAPDGSWFRAICRGASAFIEEL